MDRALRGGGSRALFLMMGFVVLGGNAWAQSVSRGDASSLPAIDYSKQFKTGVFTGFDRSFSPASVSTRSVKLPDYSGQMKSMPLAEWNFPHADRYPRAAPLRNVEWKASPVEWAERKASLHDAAPFRNGALSVRTNENWEGRNVSAPAVERPPDLDKDQIMNKFRQIRDLPPVRIGRGFASDAATNTLARPAR